MNLTRLGQILCEEIYGKTSWVQTQHRHYRCGGPDRVIIRLKVGLEDLLDRTRNGTYTEL